MLAPKVTNFFKKFGYWESPDSATFLSWNQYSFAWDDTTAYFEVDSKLFFKSEAVLYVDEEHLGMRLPDDINGEFHVVALRDCDGAMLYVLRAHATMHDLYEIYNRWGQLVASSSNGKHFPDQMQFHDENNTPIAVTQSPIVTVEDLEEHIAAAPVEPLGTPEPWEINFVGAQYGSNSSLALSQNRWVIAAAVQDRAIRDAMREAPSYGHYLFLFTVCAVVCLCIVAMLTVLSMLRRLVDVDMQAEKQRLAEPNPFIQDRSGTAY